MILPSRHRKGSETVTSTATATAQLKRSAAGTHGVTFTGVLRSELIKFWSLLSTKLLLVVSFVAFVGIGAFGAWGGGMAIKSMRDYAARQGQVESGATGVPGFEITQIPTSGVQVGMLILGALAVMMIASEYSTGMIRSSFAAVPARLPVFWGKAIVIVVVSYVFTTVSVFIAYFVSVPILNAYDVKLSLDEPGMLPMLFLSGLLVAGVALMGLALGALLRSSAGSIVVLVGIMFVLPIAASFLQLIPGEFFKYLPQYFPSQAGSRMLSNGEHLDGVLDPWAAGLVFFAWVVVLLAPAAVLLKRRDA